MHDIIKKTCKNCGREFLTRDGKQEYCNKVCETDIVEDMPDKRRARPCLACGKAFKPKHFNEKYCCKKCMTETKLARQRELNAYYRSL